VYLDKELPKCSEDLYVYLFFLFLGKNDKILIGLSEKMIVRIKSTSKGLKG